MADWVSAVCALITLVLSIYSGAALGKSRLAKDEAEAASRKAAETLHSLQGVELGVRSLAERAEDSNLTAERHIEVVTNQVREIREIQESLIGPPLVMEHKRQIEYEIVNKTQKPITIHSLLNADEINAFRNFQQPFTIAAHDSRRVELQGIQGKPLPTSLKVSTDIGEIHIRLHSKVAHPTRVYSP